jgi:hypothetical protein
MNITPSNNVWRITVTQQDGTQQVSTLTNGTLDEVHAFITALVSPAAHFRIEDITPEHDCSTDNGEYARYVKHQEQS